LMGETSNAGTQFLAIAHQTPGLFDRLVASRDD